MDLAGSKYSQENSYYLEQDQLLTSMTLRRRLCSMLRNRLLIICAVVACFSALYLFYGYQTFVKVPRYVHLGQFSSFPLNENINSFISSQNHTQLKPAASQAYRDPKEKLDMDILTQESAIERSQEQDLKSTISVHTTHRTNNISYSTGKLHSYTQSNISEVFADTQSLSSIEDKILKLQEKRKQRITDVCKEHKLKIGGNVLFKDTYRHIYVIEEQKLLFCYIPKVGCSNWKRVLMVLDGKRDVTDDITSREAHAHNGITRFGMIRKEEQEYRLRNYRKVMFVRDPLARVVSAYKNKFADLDVYRTAPPVFHKFGRRIVERYRENPTPLALTTGENITFAEFVTYLTNRAERIEFDRHWKEMYKLCSPCQVKYDFVGKLENAYDEAEYVLRNMNFTRSLSFPGRENSHPTNVASSSTGKYFENFSKVTLSKLWDIYHTDFELFGYKKPDYIRLV